MQVAKDKTGLLVLNTSWIWPLVMAILVQAGVYCITGDLSSVLSAFESVSAQDRW